MVEDKILAFLYRLALEKMAGRLPPTSQVAQDT
jgi:hypothetical protein